MNIWNIVSTGWREVFAHKFRSLLTMTGIMFGVSSLVAMSALVKGKENGMKETLVAVGGLEKIRVVPATELPTYQSHRQAEARGLNLDDVRALQNSAPLLERIHPSARLPERWARMGDKWQRTSVFAGTWPDALDISDHEIEHGRMFTTLEDERVQSVCVIGTGIRDSLFGDPEVTGNVVVPVGETIRVSGQPFRIVGMFQHYESEDSRVQRLARIRAARFQGMPTDRARNQKSGNFLFREKNNTIYIPLNTMFARMMPQPATKGLGSTQLSSLEIRIASVELIEPALQQARNILLMTHNGLEDFTFETQVQWADELEEFIRTSRISGGIIAMIALVVGGIGITNIMLASISERIREIGIRKAVGATPADVLIQILIESAVIALLGGIAGLAVGYGLVEAITRVSPLDNAPVITVTGMSVAVGFSVCVGVIAGLFPALKAARLCPIQALRCD